VTSRKNKDFKRKVTGHADWWASTSTVSIEFVQPRSDATSANQMDFIRSPARKMVEDKKVKGNYKATGA